MKEEYKDIEGYEGLYQVSNLGNVKSLGNGNSNNSSNSKERILKTRKHKYGYLIVNLCKEGKVKQYYIHRLVTEAFIPNPNNYPIINHKDEDKTNNVISNLEWCTNEYNNNYGTRNQRAAESLSKQVLCLETGKIFASTMEAQRQLGFSHSNISRCCNGKRKTAYGYTWKYVS